MPVRYAFPNLMPCHLTTFIVAGHSCPRDTLSAGHPDSAPTSLRSASLRSGKTPYPLVLNDACSVVGCDKHTMQSVTCLQEELAAAQHAKSRTAIVSARQQKAERQVDIITQIADRFCEGPLSLLRDCYRRGGRVRVVTKHGRGIRGTSVGACKSRAFMRHTLRTASCLVSQGGLKVHAGTLTAFDKYMNLVLRDVEETYVVLLQLWRGKPTLFNQPMPGNGDEAATQRESARERFRRCKKQEHRQRTLKQVFVRGDCVVLVAVVKT